LTCRGPRKTAAARSRPANPRPRTIASPAGMYMSSCTEVSVPFWRGDHIQNAAHGVNAPRSHALLSVPQSFFECEEHVVVGVDEVNGPRLGRAQGANLVDHGAGRFVRVDAAASAEPREGDDLETVVRGRDQRRARGSTDILDTDLQPGLFHGGS